MEPELTEEEMDEWLAFIEDEKAWAEERLDENGELIGDYDDFDDKWVGSEDDENFPGHY